MRYERPTIESRVPIEALLVAVSSDDQNNDSDGISDANLKANVVPVRFGPEDELPAIVSRVPIEALLTAVSSDDQNNDAQISDASLKEHIVPVAW